MNKYIKKIFAEYGPVFIIYSLFWIVVTFYAFLFSESDIRYEILFGILIGIPLLALCPLYILIDSFEIKKDASKLIVFSLFLQIYVVIWYIIKKKELKELILE